MPVSISTQPRRPRCGTCNPDATPVAASRDTAGFDGAATAARASNQEVTNVPPPLAPGTRLAHYEIGRRLGSGGMGVVYEARDTSLDRTVAVKVLDPRLAQDPAIVARFEREARAAARRNHPNLAHVYFVGSDGDTHYFAMEHVPGENLEDYVAKHGPQDIGWVVDVVVQAAEGLGAAHAAGVVHRDVKPSNVMVMADGTVKVTDFGLAKSIGGDPNLTAAGRVIGTPLFMSPEVCRDKPADQRSDIYALGLTAWFLLAGKAPFAASSIADVMVAQIHTPLPSARDVRPPLSPDVDAVLAKLCQKDPDERPSSMAEVIALFETLRPRIVRPAPFAVRAAALAVDLAYVGTVMAAAMFVSWNLLGQHTFENWLDEIALEAAGFIFLLIVEARWGVSLGKRALNLRLARSDGTSPGLSAHLLRFVIRFPILLLPTPPGYDGWELGCWTFQGVAVLVGAVWFFASGGRTLSDRLTDTQVLYDLPEDRARRRPLPAR
jgi:uncharacterized RDD family membrane protein YckC